MRILVAALSCTLAMAQTMTIEEYQPKSTLVVPQHPVQRAKYPFIDVHNHQARCLKPECLDKLVSDPGGYAVMTAVMREGVEIGRRLGFELADDVDDRIGFYRDKAIRPSMLKDFELGREPELASSVLIFDSIAKALDVSAPHIAMMAALARLKFSSLRRPP